MENKIQSLTDKIYKEGVERANKEAATIIAAAHQQHEVLIRDAKKEAEVILQKAQKEAEELRKNTESELKLYAAQALNALKSEVANSITDTIATAAVKSATDDSAFIQQLILLIAQQWEQGAPVIETAQADALNKFVQSKAKELLEKGLVIKSINGKASSFTVAPKDNSYKVTFGEDEFVAYFKEFLRPQLFKLLFQ